MEKNPDLSVYNATQIKWFTSFFNVITKIMKVMIFVLLLVMVVSVFANVVGRYVFETALNWADEISRAAFVWVAFIGIALTMWEKGHIGLGNVVSRVNPVAGKIADVVASLLTLIFAVYLILGGWQLVSLTLVQLTEYLAIPSGYIYAIVPVMSVFMFIVGIRDMLLVFRQKEET